MRGPVMRLTGWCTGSERGKAALCRAACRHFCETHSAGAAGVRVMRQVSSVPDTICPSVGPHLVVEGVATSEYVRRNLPTQRGHQLLMHALSLIHI